MLSYNRDLKNKLMCAHGDGRGNIMVGVEKVIINGRSVMDHKL